MSEPRALVVAIDGPAASGKGTLAKALAKALGFDHLDTGLLYRAVAAKMLGSGAAPEDESAAVEAARGLSASDLLAPGLRGERMGRAASICSGFPGVRAALLDYQRQFAANPPGGAGAVLDGRDIGTQVWPQADLKIWMTAEPEVRAARRRQEDPGGPSFEEVLAAIKERDHRESTRAISPLAPAPDAKTIDSGKLDAGQALAQALWWAADASSKRIKARPPQRRM